MYYSFFSHVQTIMRFFMDWQQSTHRTNVKFSTKILCSWTDSISPFGLKKSTLLGTQAKPFQATASISRNSSERHWGNRKWTYDEELNIKENIFGEGRRCQEDLVNLLCILLWTYGSGEVELMEEGITSSRGMVGTGARGEVDSWCGGNVGGWQWATEVGRGRCCSSVLKTGFYFNNKQLKSIMC